MIAVTQFTAPANCSEIFAHLNNVILVASRGVGADIDFSAKVPTLIFFVSVFVLLSAAGVGVLYLASVWGKNRK
jgi:hypothetical protein